MTEQLRVVDHGVKRYVLSVFMDDRTYNNMQVREMLKRAKGCQAMRRSRKVDDCLSCRVFVAVRDFKRAARREAKNGAEGSEGETDGNQDGRAG